MYGPVSHGFEIGPIEWETNNSVRVAVKIRSSNARSAEDYCGLSFHMVKKGGRWKTVEINGGGGTSMCT
jgi:hypothetical protein